MPNASGAGYYRFALAAADAAKLEANFGQLDEREQRTYADSVAAAFSGGVLDTPGYLRAAAKIAAAPERQTATAPLMRLGWLMQNMAATPAERQALRDFTLRLYAPRLAALGTEARPADTDDDRLLRGELLGAVAELGRDPPLRALMAAKGRRVLGLQGADTATPGDGRLHLEAVGADQRRLALRVAMEEGDATVFDALLAQAAASQDPSLRGDLLAAAGAARQPALQARTRALALAPDGVRRNEIWLLLSDPPSGADPDLAAMQAQRDWLDTNFSALTARVAPGGAFFVFAYIDGLCSTADADAVQAKFSDRLKAMEGGPRTLAQAVEVVRLCGALKTRLQASTPAVPPR
jgi:alanyl aminopeptidase